VTLQSLLARCVLLLGLVVGWAELVYAVDGYNVPNAGTEAINEWGVCRRVTNNTPGGTGLFVPTKYKGEWINSPTSFLSSTLPNVSVGDCLEAVSLRFRAANTNNLSRTFAAGNRKTWTWSGWVKRGVLGADQVLFSSGEHASQQQFGQLKFDANDNIDFTDYTTSIQGRRITNAAFRDPAGWMHVVLSVDTTDATGNNRIRLYVNGGEVTGFSTNTNPSLNYDGQVNRAGVHRLGTLVFNGAQSNKFDGYLADVHFVDGQALGASAFGEAHPVTGQWVPKAYGGGYGTTGFRLTFNNTASLGADDSGNGNNWTPNNFSTTSGATYDPSSDASRPVSNEGNGIGNYVVLNPLEADGTFSNANLTVVTPNTNSRGTRATTYLSSGKWFWEYTPTANGNLSFSGVVAPGATLAASNYVAYYANSGNKWVNQVDGGAYGATYTNNDVIGVAYDADAGTVTFYKNGSSQGVVNTSGAGPYAPLMADGSSGAGTTYNVNFGQRPFAYVVPVGFKALNSYNLPVPAIITPTAYVKPVLYTGTGSAQSITGFGFQPDLVMIKGRSGATGWAWYDSARGVQKDLDSASTAAETVQAQGLTAFNSDGFSLGTLAKTNTNGATYVAYGFRKGAMPGFDIVTYTGNGSNQTISHGLGKVPALVIVKTRSTVNDWAVYHASLSSPATKALFPNLTLAAQSGVNAWNSTAPTSSVFSVGTASPTNGNGTSYVAYLWAEVPGFSKFGSYTGNGSADGPFIFTGFRPAFVLVKRVDSTENWLLKDGMRLGYNPRNDTLYPNLANAETNDAQLDLLSNGFKLRNTTLGNASGGTYVFAAFAEAPSKYANAR